VVFLHECRDVNMQFFSI